MEHVFAGNPKKRFPWAPSASGHFGGVNFVDAYRRKESSQRPAWYDGPDSVIRAVEEFERFAWLMVKYGDQVPLVPTRVQDDIWHEFMLHPTAYFTFCFQHVQRVLDHDGGFGAEQSERESLDRAFLMTRELWASEYGQPHPADVDGSNEESFCKLPPVPPPTCQFRIRDVATRS